VIDEEEDENEENYNADQLSSGKKLSDDLEEQFGLKSVSDNNEKSSDDD